MTQMVLACDAFSTALWEAAKAVEIPEREHSLDARGRAVLDRFRPRWEVIA